MTEMRNYLVFEEYSPTKTYVKGNKVSFEGSSYVLTSESAKGTNPTDSEAWLLIAEKGNEGSMIYPFPYIDLTVGREKTIDFKWVDEDGGGYYDKDDHPGADDWKNGDILISENGKVIEIVDIKRHTEYWWFVTFKCFADIMGKSAVVDQEFDIDSKNAIANGAVCKALLEVAEVQLNLKGKANVNLSNVTNEDFKAKAEKAGVCGYAGLAGEGGGAFKRIGFTEDCDYIATSDDGRTAFVNAINDAVEGDVIMVMPGYYGGTTANTPINKDITFVGIGKPIIAFPITIGTTSQAYSVNFDNFHFVEAITCTKVDEYTSSKFYAYNSRFDGNTVTIIGSFSNCKIDYAKVYGSLPYYGDSSLCSINYYDCTIANSTLNGDSSTFRNCIIRESSIPQGYDANYSDCSLYNFQSKMGTAYQTYFNRCVIYGTSFPTSDYGPYYYECSLVSGETL